MGTYHNKHDGRKPLFNLFIQKTEFGKDNRIKGVGNPISVLGLLDSGATNTCISEKMAQTLKLISKGMVTYGSASGISTAFSYHIRIKLPLKLDFTTKISDPNIIIEFNELATVDKIVQAIPIQKQGIDMLIGMDIISMGNLYINNDYFSFEIPSDSVSVKPNNDLKIV